MNIKSTAIFDFLLKNFQKLIKFITQSYLSLLNSFLFLSRFSVSLKSLDNYFFIQFAYKSLFSRFSVLIYYNMWSSNYFSTSSCFPCFSGSTFFRVKYFQGPDFSGYGSRVQGPGPGSRVRDPVPGAGSSVPVQGPGLGSKVRVQGPGPGSGSRFQKQPIFCR